MDYPCYSMLIKPGDFLLCYTSVFKLSNKNIASTVFKHICRIYWVC